MFAIGEILKAKGKIFLYENMVYDESFNTVLSTGNSFGAIESGEQIGIVEANFVNQNFVYVQLFTPVLVNLKKRYYALIYTDNVSGITAKNPSIGTVRFFAKCNPDSYVNVRLSGSLAGTVKAKAKNGSIIGFSDGKANGNGFLKFNLALGGVGYVHQDYATKTKTVAELNKTTKTVTVINPLTGKAQDNKVTTINTNEGWEVKDVVVKTVIGAIIGFVITKILGKIFKF